jgi:hypothetical protein
MPPTPRTKSGLLTEARHVVLPKGIAASGFPRVRETCRRIGIEFDPWQSDLNKCVLAKTSDGLFAADTVVLSIARQVGKTFDIGAVVFAECIAEPGTTVIWTAHRFKVARETFNELRGLAKSPKLAPHIDYDAITTAAGNEMIPFKNGSRIVFAARERGAIRGFTKVRILVLDEAQILTHSVLADLAPTMNQATNPLILLMGTPPKPTDPGDVFAELRASALEQFERVGHSEDGVLYVEFSAEPGSNPDDRDAWRQANPSFPTRTSARAILRLRKLLSEDDFLREALGIWDSDGIGAAISGALWAATQDEAYRPFAVAAFAVESDILGDWSSISAAGPYCTCQPPASPCDGALVFADLLEHAPDTAWIVPRCAGLDAKYGPGVPFVVDKGGPAAHLIPALRDAGLNVMEIGTAEVARSFGLLREAVKERTLRHGVAAPLEDARRTAKTRPCGDGGLALGRRASGADISPLVSLQFAHWAARTSPAVDVLNSIW